MINSLFLLSVIVILFFSTITIIDVYAANLESQINPSDDEFPFKMNYEKVIFIEHLYGGDLFENLQGHEWNVVGSVNSSNSGVEDLMDKLNTKIASDGSQARISDLNISYDFHLKARDLNTMINLKITLEGTLTDYIISKDSQGTVIDLGWRGLSTNDEIILDGIEINIPINLLKEQEPKVYQFFVGTEVEEVFNQPLINADSILEQQLIEWHYLFVPIGMNLEHKGFELVDDNSEFGTSYLTMDDSPPRDSAFLDTITNYEIISDQRYTVKDIKSYNQANIAMMGYIALDFLNEVEIAKIFVSPPETHVPTNNIEPKYYWLALVIVVSIIGIFFWLTKYWVKRSHLETKKS